MRNPCSELRSSDFDRLLRCKRGLVRTQCVLLCSAVVLTAHAPLSAQTGEKSAVSFSGSATVTGDVYVFSSIPDSANAPRRPANLWRLIFAPTISFGDWLTLPFNIMISSRETNTATPSTGGSTFLQFLQNPGTNLGFISVAPTFGWAKIHIGTHTLRFSELSSGDSQIFGAGVELRPGKFRFSASAGSMQRAIEPDSAKNIRGAFARWMYLTKIGVGTEDGTFVDLNVVRTRDDPASITRQPGGVSPEEGVLVSTNARIAITDAMYITAEAGTCVFTRDMAASDLSSADNTLNHIIRQRISTRSDYAGTVAFSVTRENWGIKAASKYIGAGYVPLGYPYMQSDRLEFTLSPRVGLLDHALNISGSIGSRTNNLSGTKDETSTQLLGAANIFWTATENFNVSAEYSNFGIRNNVAQDTLRIETVSRSMNVTPSYTIVTASVIHALSATVSVDDFIDYNVVSGTQNSNTTKSILGTYAPSFVAIPLSLNLTGSLMTNDLQAGALRIASGTFGGSYRFLQGRVVPALSVTYSGNRLGGHTDDRQLYIRVSGRWQITNKIALNLAVSQNRYVYGSSRLGVRFVETYFQTSLSTQW